MITIRSGRHPLAVTLLAFFAISGLSNLLTYSQSASNSIRALPEPLGQIFFAVLVGGSVLALVGVFTPGLIGPMLERAGLSMLTGLLTCYSVLAIATAGLRALFFAFLLLGFAVGYLVRIVQIGRELRDLPAAAAFTRSSEHLEDG